MWKYVSIPTWRERLCASYGAFFSRYTLVVSVPTRFFWVGEHAAIRGAPAVLQKLPLRVYIGIRQTDDSSIILETLKCLNRIGGRFDDVPGWLDGSEFKQLAHFATSYFHERGRSFGLRIGFLTEAMPQAGLNFLGAMSAGLAKAFRLIVGETGSRGWADDEDFLTTYRLGLEIERFFKESSGANIAIGLDAGPDPIFFCYRGGRDDITLFPLRDRNVDSEAFVWPLDFAVLFSGIQQNSPHTTQVVLNNLDALNDTKAHLFRGLSLSEGSLHSWLLHADWKDLKRQEIALTALLLSHEIRMFLKGQKEVLPRIFDRLNSAHHYLKSLGASSDVIERMRYFFLGRDHDLGVKILGGGQAGSILIVSPFGALRERFDAMITEVRRQVSRDIVPLYRSWEDGFEEESVRVEQDDHDGAPPAWMRGERVTLRVWERSSRPRVQLVLRDALPEIIKDFDLFIDGVRSRMCVRGHPLTSRDVHSQRAIAVLILFLLRHIGERVAADQLPLDASYCRDRNELQSKLISPILRVIRRRCRLQLPLKVTGGLASKFSVTLLENPLTIASIT